MPHKGENIQYSTRQISKLRQNFKTLFCFDFLSLIKRKADEWCELISSSGRRTLPFCADRWRANQRTCGTTRCVTEPNTFQKSQTELNQHYLKCNTALCHVCPSGPFVMTTEEEIKQAIRDYQSGRNGFERAINWRSKIREAFWTPHVALLVKMYA